MKRAEEHAEDTCPLVYRCRLPLSTRTVNHLADLLRRHLKAIRSRVVLRHDQRLADMADGISESTVRRWRDEAIGLLAAQAPRLDRACRKIARQGGEVVLIDCTLISTQRRTGKADRKNYSGKHRHHGLHFLALTAERGRLIWISAARPGRTHDDTAARHDHILAHLRAADLEALADLGFRGLDNDLHDPVIVTGFQASRTHKLTPDQKEPNRVLAVGTGAGRARLRPPQTPGVAPTASSTCEPWRTTCSPSSPAPTPRSTAAGTRPPR